MGDEKRGGGGELARCLLCRSIALFRDSVFV